MVWVQEEQVRLPPPHTHHPQLRCQRGEQEALTKAAQAYLTFWGQRRQWSEALAAPAGPLQRLEGTWLEGPARK